MEPHNQHGQPQKDLGSYVKLYNPSDTEINDHRSSVCIGLHVPKQKHRHKRHRHRRLGDKTQNCQPAVFRDATHPAQRVQFLLGEEEDEEHKAHDLFCEMEELFYNGDKMEWKESARWIKFEEDVEEGGERWSKPHVATLSLHSLFELRCNILTGTIMLDIEPFDLSSLVDLVLDSAVACKQLEEHLKSGIRDILLLKHRHQNQKKVQENGGSKYHLPSRKSFADFGKKNMSPKDDEREKARKFQAAKSTPNFGLLIEKEELSALEAAQMPKNSSTCDLSRDVSHKSLHFMKKIPQGAEAANILVGEVELLTYPVTALVRLLHPIIMPDLTEVPVPTKFVFVLLGPKGHQSRYHEVGRSIATLMSDEVFHDVAYHAKNREDILAGIDEFLDQVTVLPPGEWDPSIRIEPPKQIPSQESRKTFVGNPPLPNGKAVQIEEDDKNMDPSLVRTGRLCGGLFDDVKRKIPWYISDFKDAFHIQCVASFIFLYFACLTPIITFGVLMADATNNSTGAFESIFGASLCGVIYALTAGQPLTILGFTGPVLVFETILYSLCSDNGWNYLEFRLWIGLWIGVLFITFVLFDLSALVQYITRFTEESFALLISVIFILEAIAKLIHISDSHPIHLPHEEISKCTGHCLRNDTVDNSTVFLSDNYTKLDNNTFYDIWTNKSLQQCILDGGEWHTTLRHHTNTEPEVFFFSFILFIGTFAISVAFKGMRNKPYFPAQVKQILSDFSVIIAIVLMVGLDAYLGINTPKLQVPGEFRPTDKGRPWLINPVGHNPWWLSFAAILPAMLATILLFMDQQITIVIVNRKENKLKKGHGYHLDLFLVATLIIMCSFLGLPWFVAETVLSITHVTSLKRETECSAPGERPKFLGVWEQRVTGVAINLMIGISILMTSVLKFIPMPVLYGVFLYMGVSSLQGMQLVDRVLLWLMPQKYQPDYMYLRHVRTWRVHLFTCIQVLCLIILWIIKSIKKTSITFPLMVLAMCFVRKGLDKIFTQKELKWLDDIMPESHNRAKEDESKSSKIKTSTESDQQMLHTPGTVMVPLCSGNVINIPVERITLTTASDINISEEMAKTTLWKTMVANESSSSLTDTGVKRSHKHKEKNKNKSDIGELPTIVGSLPEENRSPLTPKQNKMPVFFLDDEEKEHLLNRPCPGVSERYTSSDML